MTRVYTFFFQHVFLVKQKLTENKKVYVHEEREACSGYYVANEKLGWWRRLGLS
jgi:hypothetical protein